MNYAIKIIFTVLIVLGATEAAKRVPAAGALINALPLMSLIVMCMLYYDTGDSAKVAAYARDVPPLVVPSIAFFYVFAFLVEYKVGFVMAMLLAVTSMLSLYGIYLFLQLVLDRNMPIEILMPALSPTMTEGNLAKWTVKEGDKIKSGQVIAEIETDKATMEVEAVDEGTMGKIVVASGTEGVKVNQLIALLLEEGEDKAALETYKPKAAPAQAAAAPAATAPAASSAPAAAPAPTAAPTSAPSQSPSLPAGAPQAPMRSAGERVFASPLAKRIAAQEGVDIGGVAGTGPHGRVLRDDVLKAKASGNTGRSGRVMRNPTEFTKVPNSNMRKVIARRLTESKQQVPHFYLTVEVELNKLLDIRKDINFEAEAVAGKEKKPAYKVSVNDFIIKGVGLALKKVPAANASWYDDAIVQYNNIDISVAVAIEGGLITPIVKNADQKSVITVSGEMKDLAVRARTGKLAPEEFQGGGFSISNLGMFGVKTFSAIVNPPQGCILAVGAGEDRVVVRHGQMVVRNMVDLTLSVDHRVVDGAVGAEFLAALKHVLESPALLLL